MLLAFLFAMGCEPTIDQRCAAAEVRACCMLSRAEAESVLGSSAGQGQGSQGEGYSTCSYHLEDGRFAELLLLEPDSEVPVRFLRLRRELESGRLREVRRMPIPNFEGVQGFWAEDLPLPESRKQAFWVTAGPDFFRVTATPLGGGWPDWKRARDLSRSVLRNLESSRG